MNRRGGLLTSLFTGSVISCLSLLEISLPHCAQACPDTCHMPVGDVIAPSFYMLRNPWRGILLVSVTSVNAGPHCNTNPPAGTFRITRILRGFDRCREARFQWKIDSTGEENYVAWDSKMPRALKETYFLRPHTEEWCRSPIPSPPLDTPLIVFTDSIAAPWGGTYNIDAIFTGTDDNIATVLNNMEETDRNPNMQMLFARTILILPLISAGMIIVLCLRRQLRRRSIMMLTWACAILPVPLYLIYESGNRTGGIRLDLFLLYPAVGFGVIVFLVEAVIYARWRRRNAILPPSIPRG